jgi:hypothetical protein
MGEHFLKTTIGAEGGPHCVAAFTVHQELPPLPPLINVQKGLGTLFVIFYIRIYFDTEHLLSSPFKHNSLHIKRESAPCQLVGVV